MGGDHCAVTGVGVTSFGKHLDRSLKQLTREAVREALADANTAPDEIDMVFVANAVGAITTGQVAVVGQVALDGTGITGVPLYNVDNACAGSSSALNLATHALRAGVARRVLTVGVEKLYAEDRALTFQAINAAADVEWVASTGVDVSKESVFMKRVYAERLRAYDERWPLSVESLAAIAVKNRAHAAFNEKAQFRKPLTVEEVLGSRIVQEPIRALMCAPIGDGATAAVLVDEELGRRDDRAVWIRASHVTMGSPPPRERSTISRLASKAYMAAGVAPEDVDVAEVHDATAFSELLAYEELGWCEPGEGSALAASGETSLGGRIPVNTGGGLESRGHPLAATGLAQVAELVSQLRGEAGERQVDGARIALAETAGGYVNGDSAAVALTILGVERP